jgi:hypothetical protein
MDFFVKTGEISNHWDYLTIFRVFINREKDIFWKVLNAEKSKSMLYFRVIFGEIANKVTKLGNTPAPGTRINLFMIDIV